IFSPERALAQVEQEIPKQTSKITAILGGLKIDKFIRQSVSIEVAKDRKPYIYNNYFDLNKGLVIINNGILQDSETKEIIDFTDTEFLFNSETFAKRITGTDWSVEKAQMPDLYAVEKALSWISIDALFGAQKKAL